MKYSYRCFRYATLLKNKRYSFRVYLNNSNEHDSNVQLIKCISERVDWK